jgi:hypothetical protein
MVVPLHCGTGQGHSCRRKLPPFHINGKPFDSRLRMRQIIALRFAGDDEMPALVKRAIDEIMTQRQIKEAIKTWRADYNRA